MATPSAPPHGAARTERRARLPSPALLASGAALAVAGLWLARTPIAENWARAAMLDRHVELGLKIKRLDFTGIEVDEMRLGPEKAPAFEAAHARVHFKWKAPWKVELDDIELNGAHWTVGLNDNGLDLRGVKALFNAPAPGAKKGGAMIVRRFSAPDATITLESKFGEVNARGAVAGDLAAKNYGANFEVAEGRLRGPGLDGRLNGGTFNARVVGDALTINADLQAAQIASAFADAGDLNIIAKVNARGFGGSVDKLVGALDVTANGSGLHTYGETIATGLFVARVEKSDGPVDRVSWKMDGTDLGGAWAIAPAATFAGGFSGALPINARLDGRGGWSFTAPEARLGDQARERIRRTLIEGNWPDPLKSPFAAAGESLLRAGEGLSVSASGDLIANDDGLTIRALRADAEARSNAQLVLTSAPGAAIVAAGPKGLTGQGQLSIGGGGTPPLVIDLAQLSSDKNGWSANASMQLSRWSAGDSQLAFNAPSIVLKAGKAEGELNVQADALYSGPIAGGRIEEMALKLPAHFTWAKNSWKLESDECLRVSAASWSGAGTQTGAFAGAPCPAGGIVARSDAGQISGRSDWTKVSIPARAGDKASSPRLLLSADAMAISLSGATSAPHALISIPDANLQITTRSEEEDRDVTTVMDAKVFTIELAPSDGGTALDMQTQGVSIDLDGTTLEVADATANMKGVMAPHGLDAEITNVTARVRDPGASPMVADLLVTGQGRSEAGRIGVDMIAQPEKGGPQLATIRITHNLSNGQGRAVANTDQMRFGPARQPQDVFPALQGLVANVRGGATGIAEARWGEAGFSTNGTVNLEGLEFATFSLGPIQGVTGKIKFDNLLKPSTPLSQHIEAKMLNPGVAVEDLSLDFQLQSLNTMRIEGGHAKVVGGSVLIEPVTWSFGPQRQDFAMVVEDAPIEEILKLFNNPDLKGTGVLRGRIPMSLEKGRMRVNHARLEAVGEGKLQVNVPAATQAAADNKFVTLAFDALRDLQFTLLAVDVDGEVDGRLENKLLIRGKSPTASNLPFVYNISLSAQILPLIQQARYIYDKSAIGDYTRGLSSPASDVPVTIDAAPAPKE